MSGAGDQLGAPGAAARVPTSRPLDPDSEHWLAELRAAGAEREVALVDLHHLMTRVAHREVARRAHLIAASGPELDDLAVQAAGDAMLAVLAKLDDFRGESRFTTWVYKFVMFEVSAKIGRHYWRHAAPAHGHVGGSKDWDQLPDRLDMGPEDVAVRRDLVQAVAAAVDEVLTPHQRQLFVAVVLRGTPLDAVVIDLGTTRNAVYKALFDGRRKIRAALVASGHLDDDPRRPS